MAEVISQGPMVATDVSGRLMPSRPLISWGAIFGGAFAALGLWLLEYAFGLAVGLSAIDRSGAHGLRGLGIFSGIWGLLSPLIALFVGSFVAARVSGVASRGAGAAHGLVMWGLTTVGGAYVTLMVLGRLIAGAVVASAAAAQSGGPAVGVTVTGGNPFWGVFGALLLGLIAALFGGVLGVPEGGGRRRERVVATATRPVVPPPPREVYP